MTSRDQERNDEQNEADRNTIGGERIAYEAIVGVIRHAVNGHLGNIDANCKILRNELTEKSYDKELDAIERSVDHISIIMGHWYQILELERPIIEHVSVGDLMERIEFLARSMLRLVDKMEVVIQPSVESCSIETDSEVLLAVVIELIKNAKRALREEGGRVEISAMREGDQVAFYVEDDGCGIPTELRDRVLKERLPSNRGKGFSLYLSHKAIAALGGTLRLQSSSDKGTIFVISLPISSINAGF